MEQFIVDLERKRPFNVKNSTNDIPQSHEEILIFVIDLTSAEKISYFTPIKFRNSSKEFAVVKGRMFSSRKPRISPNPSVPEENSKLGEIRDFWLYIK
jgi:hypothetical protein